MSESLEMAEEYENSAWASNYIIVSLAKTERIYPIIPAPQIQTSPLDVTQKPFLGQSL